MGRLLISLLATASLAGAVTPATQAASEAFNTAAVGLYQDPGFGVNRQMSAAATDTVDPFSGALKILVKDLVIPGNGGLDIEVLRNYESITNTAGPYSNGHTERTPFGAGWDINFGRLWVSKTYSYLNQGSTNGVCQLSQQAATNLNPILELPDGTKETLAGGDGKDTAFISKNRWIGRCLPTALNTGEGGLIVISPAGLKYIFNLKTTVSADVQLRTYVVTRIEDPNGNYLNFTYSKTSANVFGANHVLTGINASDGRTVSFRYSGLNTNQVLLTNISGAGKTVNYGYTNANWSVGAKPQYLTRVSYADGTGWNYTYQNSSTVTGSVPGRFSMLSMESPLGLKTAYGYAIKQMGSTPAELLNVITSRVLSGVRGSTHATQAWSYTYSKGYSPNNDSTLEVGPVQCVRYTHVGANTVPSGTGGVDQGLWKIGLLLRKEILAKSGSSCGAVERTETNTWAAQNISEQNEMRRYNLLVENYTRAAILTRKVVNQNGLNYITDYSYDGYGQPLTVAESGQKSRTTSYSYIRPGGLWMLGKIASKAVSGITGSVINSYDKAGNLVQSNNYGVVTSFTYLPSGAVASIKDANNHVTVYSDYHRGVPRGVIFPDGGILTRAVNDSGTVASSTDPLRRLTRYSYDAADRLTAVIPPKGAASAVTIAYSFSPNNVIQTLTRGAYSRAREFNQLGQLIKQTESGATLAPIIQVATYTPDGRKAFVSNPSYTSASSIGESFTFDTLGRLLKNTHGDGTYISSSYPAGSNSTVTGDERANVTTATYSAYGEPFVRQLTSLIQPAGVISTVTTDNLGRITSSSQGGLVRSYSYDAKGFLSSETNPETGTTTYAYDAKGNVLSKKVAASPADSYSYDASDRLASINFAGASTLSNGYDLAGRLLTQRFAGTSWNYAYDAHDKLTQESLLLSSPARTFSVGYAYDAADSLQSITYPSGRVIAYNPDALGRATQAGAYATGISYQANGALQSLRYGNGRVLSITQDPNRLRTTSRTVGGADIAMKLGYGYDGANNLTAVSDGQNPAASQVLGYDPLNRLTSSTGLWGTAYYTYNTRGDLTAQSGIRALTYGYDAQGRLSSLRGDINATLSYDTQGRVLNARGRYSYDPAGNLTALCLPLNNECSTTPDQRYAYDGKGKRVLQLAANGETVLSVYGQQGKLLFEETTPASGATSTKEYIYGAGELLAQVSAEQTTYQHNGLLGSPVAATNTQGGLAWRAHFQPYGDRQEKSTTANFGTIGYTGHAQDRDSELVYAGGRFYDPVIGRFLQADPEPANPLNPASFNRYQYANNNPYSYTDPSGRNPLGVSILGVPAGYILGTAVVAASISANMQALRTHPDSFAAYDRPFNESLYNANVASFEAFRAKALMNESADDDEYADVDVDEKSHKESYGRKDKNRDKNKLTEGEEPATEQYVGDLAKQIRKDLGRDAQREFHNLPHGADRTKNDAQEGARELYERKGVSIPKWLMKGKL